MKKLELLTPATPLPALIQRKTLLEQTITALRRFQKTAPDGSLRITRSRGLPQYYHVTESFGSGGAYMTKKNLEQIKLLAQKDYNSKKIPALEKELKKITRLITFYTDSTSAPASTPDPVFESLTSARQTLVTPVTLSDNRYAELWQKEEYTHKETDPQGPQFITGRGEHVRSKSEIIIADTLYRLGIPYRYEFPLRLKTFSVHPDFYCLNVHTRQEYAWEHFGMMDNQEYLASAMEKLYQYHASGYFEGKNLITTMETSRYIVNARTVEQVARQWLL